MLEKITEQDIETSGVAGAPDKLEGDPAENKRVFDRLVKEVVARVVNAIIEAHNALGRDVDQLAKQLSDHVDIDPGNLKAENVGLLRELADRYGLTDKLAPTVQDALEVLGALLGLEKYQEYWWVRRTSATTIPPVVGEPVTGKTEKEKQGLYIVDGTWSADATAEIQCADAVQLDVAGNVVLVDPVAEVVKVRELNDASFWQGKYVKNNKGTVIYIPEDATVSESVSQTTGGVWRCVADPVCPVSAELPDRPWERVHSTDRDAYPDEGELDGAEYRYMGFPVERLIDMMVKEATTE